MKEGVVLICLILACFLLVNFVSAETLVSSANVSYDSRILDEFENNTLVNVIITLENSVNIDNFVANFSNDELKDVINRDIPDKSSNRFGAKISEEAFLKLIQDDGVRNIEYNGIGHIFYVDKENKSLLLGIILSFIILIVVIFIIIRWRKKVKNVKKE